MRVLARDGVAKVHSITAPLLFVSLGLVVAVHIPHVGVSVNGARRWIGPAQLQFQPSELLKIALVLYCATLLAKRPARVNDLKDLARPLLYVAAAACLLVATQPDIGTAMVICFTVGRDAGGGGHRAPHAGQDRRDPDRLRAALRDRQTLCARSA